MDLTFSEDKENSTKRNVVFFDLDRTLISEISGKAIIKMAWEKGLISARDLLKAFYLFVLFKFNLRDPLKIIDNMVVHVRGKSEAELEKLCLHVFREVLFPSVYTEAITEIHFHKENDTKVFILSSTLNYICNAMSESLGLDGYICSYLEAEDGYLTGQPAGRLCYGPEKLFRLTEYCADNNISQSDIWYYSDSISDLPVLSSVGKAICVNPDRELKKEALRRGWKILLWQN
jgi:HAD superfamily hydrolase (TIGR01490 family)